ncbi:MAG: hypothetical protein J6M93_02960 [Succinivibrio sp.]|nr:hypothetical protein [Succinivibrio sp.]
MTCELETRIEVLDRTLSGKIRLIPAQLDSNSRTGKVCLSFSEQVRIALGTPALVFITLPQMPVRIAVPC